MEIQEIIQKVDEAIEKLGEAPELDDKIIRVEDLPYAQKCIEEAYNLLDKLNGELNLLKKLSD